MKRYLNRSLRILLAVDLMSLTAVAMIAPIQAVFVQKIGGDILDAGLASTVFALAAAIVVFLSGKWGDGRKHRHRIVALGYGLTGIGFLMYLAVDSVIALFFVQIWVGMSQAFLAPAFDALYTSQISSKRRVSSRWGMWEAENYLSIALGGVMGGAIAKYAGFNTLFLVMATMCFLSAAYLVTRPNRFFKA